MATSTKQVIATVPVYDYLQNPGNAVLTGAPALGGKQVKVTLAYDKARSIAPSTWLENLTVYSTLTDANGFWQVNVVPTDNITPANTYYIVEVEGYLSYKINPVAAGIPGIGWQSSAILLDIPASLTPAGQTITGPLTVTGLLTASGGMSITGQLTGAVDLAVRSITVLPSGPYVPTAAAGFIDALIADRGGETFNVKSSRFGAKGDGKHDSNLAIASGTAALSSTTTIGPFSASDVGKSIGVTGAGVAAGSLNTTILSFTDSKHVTLNANASTTIVSAGFGAWGTDDTTAIQAAVNAVPSPGGVIFFPPGMYICNLVDTPNTATIGYIFQGCGIDVTFLQGTLPSDHVLGLHANGAVRDMTLDGCGAMPNVLTFTNFTAGVTIDEMVLERTKCTNNIGGGWVFVCWDQLNAYTIHNLWMNEVMLVGPSSPTSDAFATTYVDTVYVNNCIFRNLYRSPNFYLGHRLFINGLNVIGVANFAGMVIDSGMDHAEVTNFSIDSTSAGANFNGADIRIHGGRQDVSPLVNLGNTATQRFEMDGVYIGGAIGLKFPNAYFKVHNCDFVPTASAGNGTIGSYGTAGGTYAGIIITNNRLDNTNNGGRFIGSSGGDTWTDAIVTGNKVVGGGSQFNLTLGATAVVADNPGAVDISAGSLTRGSEVIVNDLTLGSTTEALNGRLVSVQDNPPTVASPGAGVSAQSVIAGGTNTEMQIQATLTAVAPGVVIGIVTLDDAPLASAPKAVVCSLSAPTAGVAAPPVVGADTFTTSGFTLRSYGPTVVTTGTYIITCHCFF